MKNNSVFTLFLIVLAITVAFAVIVRVCFLDKHVKDEVSEGRGSVQPAILKEKVEVITDDAWEEYEDAERVVVELVERTTIESENGSETEYDRYIVSDVDLKAQMDDTRDYHDALMDSDEDIGEGNRVSFKDAFGINYKGLNGKEVYQSLLNKCGFSSDFNDVLFDDSTHEITGQNLYIYENKCDVIDYLLEGELYSEVVDSKVCYQLEDKETGTQLPEYFSASVSFKNGDQVVTKSLYLSVSIEKSDGGKEECDA